MWQYNDIVFNIFVFIFSANLMNLLVMMVPAYLLTKDVTFTRTALRTQMKWIVTWWAQTNTLALILLWNTEWKMELQLMCQSLFQELVTWMKWQWPLRLDFLCGSPGLTGELNLQTWKTPATITTTWSRTSPKAFGCQN